MDGLGIENAISQANAMTSQAENARAAQSTLIRRVLPKALLLEVLGFRIRKIKMLLRIK